MNSEIVTVLQAAYADLPSDADEPSTGYLMYQYQELSREIISGALVGAELAHAKKRFEELDAELTLRRDLEYPLGPLRADGRPDAKNFPHALNKAREKYEAFCSTMDHRRDTAKGHLANYLAATASAVRRML